MNDALFQILSNLTPLAVICAYENGVEPPKPFITYELKLERTPEHLCAGELDSQGNQTLRTHVDATLELNCYGAEPLAPLRHLAMHAYLYGSQSLWEQYGITLVEVGNVTHLAYLDEAKRYQHRAVLELAIRYRADIVDSLHIIEQVQAEPQLSPITDIQNIGA